MTNLQEIQGTENMLNSTTGKQAAALGLWKTAQD